MRAEPKKEKPQQKSAETDHIDSWLKAMVEKATETIIKKEPPAQARRRLGKPYLSGRKT